MTSDFGLLDEDHRVKFELLKDYYKGIVGFLAALRGIGYIPDHGRKSLAVAIDELYAKVEKS